MRELLTRKEVAAFLKVKPQTVAVWDMKGIGVRFFIIGARSIRYRREDVEAFVRDGGKPARASDTGEAAR